MKRYYEAPDLDIMQYQPNECLAVISGDPDLDNKDNWIEVPLG